MEKEREIQCVPIEFLDRLKALAARLWDDKNPASVHLATILQEFEQDISGLGKVIKEYDEDFAKKENRFRKEIDDLKGRLARSEDTRGEAMKRLEELRASLAGRESALAEMKLKTTEEEGELNSKYVGRMQELYDKVSKKEMTLLSRWEEKNKSVELRAQEAEAAYAARERQLKIREKAIEEEFNARKTELIKTFDRIREGLEAREKALAAREAEVPGKGGAV